MSEQPSNSLLAVTNAVTLKPSGGSMSQIIFAAQHQQT
jgi:hypothetical protein